MTHFSGIKVYTQESIIYFNKQREGFMYRTSNPRSSVYLSLRQNLTKVFSRGAVITEDGDDAGPEHLQGRYVGRKDTERTGQRGHVDLLHAGLFEKHLESGDK